MQNNTRDRQRADLLKSRTPFDRLTEDELDWLEQQLVDVSYARDDIVLEPGLQPDGLYFVVSGVVQLEAMGKVSDDSRVLAELVEGESFPLEALQEERPVFSTFRARTDVRCVKLPIGAFRELSEKSKPFGEFCKQRATAFLEQSRRIYHTHFASDSTATHLASPLRGLVQGTPATCRAQDTLGTLLPRMQAEGLSVIAVVDEQHKPLGTFSLADLLAASVAGKNAADTPVEAVMNREIVALSAESLGFEAAMMMADRGVGHILVLDHERLVAVVPERALFALQSVGIAQLARQVHNATNPEMLARSAADIRLLAHNLLGQRVAANQLTRIVSLLTDRLTERILELELARHDLSDVEFCWIALGSEGRLEQTLCTDQDNGIVFGVPEGGDVDALRQRLLPFAKAVNQTLHDCGFPLCKGGVMASNPKWCLSLAEWQQSFSDWVKNPEPEALLNATIFFDLRPIWGHTGLAEKLLDWLARIVSGSDRFLHLMTENALQRQPPIGFFRDFVVDKGGEHPNTIDLKLSAVTLFVDAARVLGLAHGVTNSNTERRLSIVAEKAGLNKKEVDAWVEAFHFMQNIRLRHQHSLTQKGEESHNRVDPYTFNPLDRKIFLEALRQAGLLQKRVSSSMGVQS